MTGSRRTGWRRSCLEDLRVLKLDAVHGHPASPAPESRDDPDLISLGEAVGASGSGRLCTASPELTDALKTRSQRNDRVNARIKVHLVLSVVAGDGSHC